MNIKKFLSFVKFSLLVAVVATTAFLAGCNDDDDGPQIYNGTIMDLIEDARFQQSTTVGADVALDSLAKYLNKYPSLVTLLDGTTEYTLFAPSNQAFINLLATPGFPERIEQINPAIIQGVLAYHIVNGRQLTSALTSGASFTTNYPNATTDDKIIVNSNGTLKTGSTNQDIDIVSADHQAQNGVVHVVESVMIPQSVGASLTPILGTMAGTVMLGADFSYLAQLVTKADANFTENPGNQQFKIITMLANPNANATFFAPPNAVIAAAAGGESNVQAFLNGINEAAARAILLNHYVPGRYVVTATTGATTFSSIHGETITAASGKNLTVNVGTPSTNNPHGVAIVHTPTGGNPTPAPIVVKDLSHNNGFIQAIAGIIMP